MVVDSHWCHSLGDGIHPLVTLTGEWFWLSHDDHPLSTAIPMARDEHLMMGITWWRSPDEDDCLIHWVMILTEWWSSPSDGYLWQLSSSDRDHWLMTPIEQWLSWLVSLMVGEYHGWWVVPSDSTQWVMSDGWRVTIMGNGHHLLVTITITWESSSDARHRVMTITCLMVIVWWWLSSDDDDDDWWCHLTMMIGITEDDCHWEMRTPLWWHTLGDENHCYRSIVGDL